MKPPAFDYERPRDVEEAVSLLAERGEDCKVLAGGQSLVPLLNFRLAAPACLVDINRLGALSAIRRHDGWLRMGALTRQASVERSRLVAGAWPLLTEAVRHIAHAQIRSRGTIGGSVAHGDPAAELPAVLTALDARYKVRSLRAERVLDSSQMFVGQLTTALEPDELLVEIEVPPVPPGSGSAFAEFALRSGDFALAGAAALLTLDPDGACSGARVVLLAAAATPVRATPAEQRLVGGRPDAEARSDAAELATADIQPPGDLHGSSRYRRRLMRTLVARVVDAAATRAALTIDARR